MRFWMTSDAMTFLDPHSIRRIWRERTFATIGFIIIAVVAIGIYALLPVWLAPLVMIVWVPVFYVVWFGFLGT